MEKYATIKEFPGYATKADILNQDSRFLAEGSQNMIIDKDRKLKTREGYEMKGAESSGTTPIESSYTWKNSRGDERALRSYDDELEVYLGTIDGVAINAWTKLKDGWTAVDFSFATVWDTVELIDRLLFVNGSDKMWNWTGAVTTVNAVTSNTIKKNGTNTWAQEGFDTAGTRKVIINGTEYTYTGGETTTTLTGVTPDPSGEAVDSPVMQAVEEHDNTPADGFNADVIGELNNQIWVGSETSRRVYVSKDSDWTDFTFSSPRVPGDGALLTLDQVCKALVPLEQDMYVATDDFWYHSEFHELDISGTLSETLKVKRLKTGTKQGALSRDLIAPAGNAIAFISKANVCYLIGRFEDLEGINLRNLSDPIQPDFDAEDFTSGHMKWDDLKRRIYICSQANDKLYIHEQDEDRMFWQPPQILPLRRLEIIDDDLHGHSSAAPETYKLFTGENDNGNSFKCSAVFAYNDFGDRVAYKVFDEYMTEGYISANTTLKLNLKYDFDGYTQETEFEIDGDNDDILFRSETQGILGDNPLGDESQGGSGDSESGIDLAHFLAINEMPPEDFQKLKVEYWTDEIDAQFEILSHGANARLSANKPTGHKI